MKTGDPEDALAQLHEAAERISANLVELEIDSSRQLLEASTLTGESAVRWSAASDELTELWRRKALLEGLLARAEKLRGSRHADELRSLLEGPSIELASTDVPLAERRLLGSAQAEQRCSPDQLLAGMSSSFDEVKTVVARIGGAWETLIPKLDVARAQLQESVRVAGDLGEGEPPELEAASRTLAELSASVTSDPLSVAPSEIDAAIGSLNAIHHELEASAALRREFDARMLAVRELLERLRAALGEWQAAHTEVLRKIVAPTVPAAPDRGRQSGAELGEIERLAEQGAWRDAQRRLEQWTARTNDAVAQAARGLAANRAPIEARNQFRALLGAYQVKAKRLGVLEDPEVAEIFTQAEQELYTAPTDLSLAAQLVQRYQQAISGPQPTPEATP